VRLLKITHFPIPRLQQPDQLPELNRADKKKQKCPSSDSLSSTCPVNKPTLNIPPALLKSYLVALRSPIRFSLLQSSFFKEKKQLLT
jgi:hypothetical protein